YTFRILPIGGFVRMAGEDPEMIQINPGQTIGILVQDGAVTKLYLDQLERRDRATIGEVESIDLERDMHVRMIADGQSVSYPVHPQAHMVARGAETQIAPLDRQ